MFIFHNIPYLESRTAIDDLLGGFYLTSDFFLISLYITNMLVNSFLLR